MVYFCTQQNNLTLPKCKYLIIIIHYPIVITFPSYIEHKKFQVIQLTKERIGNDMTLICLSICHSVKIQVIKFHPNLR